MAFYDTDKSKLECVLTPPLQYDTEPVDLSSGGTTLTWTENVDGYSGILTNNLKNEQLEEITNLSLNGVIEDLKLSPDGKRMRVMMSTPTLPSDICVVDLDKDDNKIKDNNIRKISLGY